ncbi:hypothetical protein NE547_16225, partial [Flavonifractor sp. DFI.6.63]|uniref:hypothetical protein n=1 Tax=Flavonifractor sp. DFI.6.63 TaxID=2963704 RepID=UPI00210B7034
LAVQSFRTWFAVSFRMVVSQLHSTRHLQTMSLCLFAKLILPDRNFPLLTYQYRYFLDLPKMGAKKAANLFQTYCFMCRYGAAVIQL